MNSKIIFLSFLSLLSFYGFYAQDEIINMNKNFKVFSDNGKWGFKKNNVLFIPAKFEYVSDFSENFALVKENGKWGYIDTIGNWFINPEFDKAQPIQFGQAFTQKNNKTGLIRVELNELTNEYSWKVILEPIYDKVKEDYNAYTLYMGDKKGFFSKYDFALIPANYLEISDDYGLISAKKEENNWDIYYQGKLILENVSNKVENSNILESNKKFIVEKSGKYGVFQIEKGWIVEAKYDFIEALNFPAYKIGDEISNQLFALHTKDLSYTYDETGEEIVYNKYYPDMTDSIFLAKENGTLITNQIFNEIVQKFDMYSDIQEVYAIQLRINDKISLLYPNFSIKYLQVESLYKQAYSWYFGNSTDKAYIFNSKFNAIDSFSRIERYKEISYPYVEYYDEYGNEIIDPETGLPNYDNQYTENEITEEPFLIVFRKIGQLEEKAIYDLYEQKIVSPWISDPQNNLSIAREYLYNNLIYVYTIDNKQGFYSSGMNEGTVFKYEPELKTTVLGQNFYFKVPTGENLYSYDLYGAKDEKVIFISSDYEISQAENYNFEEFVYDEFGEYYIQTFKPFKSNFIVLKKNNKFGLISLNGKIFEPIYDTLYQSENDELFVHTMKNGKYGRINLLNGNCVEAEHLYEVVFYESKTINGQELYYTLITEDNYNESTGIYSYNSYHLFENNKKLFANFDLIFPKKIKKKYGLFGYSDYADSDTPNELIKPVYRFLEQSQFKGLFKAQGKNKKWGIINVFGDTVVPLNYSKLIPNVYSSNVYTYYVFNRNKIGIYQVDKGELIPPIYEKIESNNQGDGIAEFYFSTLNKKVGIHDSKGEKLVDNQFDEIILNYFYTNDDYSSTPFFECKKKGKFYTLPVSYKNSDYESIKLVAYDFIVIDKGFVKKGNKYEIYDILTNELIETQNLEELKLNGMLYTIVVKNGKFGAVDFQGNELVPCEYEFATFMENRDEVMIGYQNGVKYYIYVDNNERFTEDQW